MKPKLFLLSVIAFTTLFSFGLSLEASAISKKLKKANAKISRLQNTNKDLQGQYSDCRDTVSMLREQLSIQRSDNSHLTMQLRDQKESNERVLNHLKDLSVISGTQAESINKFLESMGVKDAYIRDLQSIMARKDSMTNGTW